ncbi:uncharacterized protein JN550_007707 [Neoarthrinium moseri]|uniref:uncharacterized protein n=1 Tax=Neoarthrinium moseri TaxID=1658444 RepID=UPI001FDBCF6D|nr:uncharacterized protein JN550_007707 [Neoarthrinium moseri]KAI1866319.1 hypothetical protein JN550_007707 [Neoarthrinium moseri]
MLSTWLTRCLLRCTAPRPPVPVLPSSESPTAISTPEAEKSQEAQDILKPPQLQKPQAPDLGLLPAELILLVSELLPAADAVCLALTCKRMCYISDVQNLARRLDFDATETLLGRLERDMTGVSYCAIEQKLARFDTRMSTWLPVHFHLHTLYKPRQLPAVGFASGHYFLPWCAARVATNYQILGPRRGLPASFLAYTYEPPPQEHGICRKEAWAASLWIASEVSNNPSNLRSSTFWHQINTHRLNVISNYLLHGVLKLRRDGHWVRYIRIWLIFLLSGVWHVAIDFSSGNCTEVISVGSES